MAKVQRLIFVDANIWLDFYRARTDAGLKLLNHLETISDRIIVTYQLEMEFKKNRQAAIAEGLQELKPPQNISRPALFSDAKAVRSLAKSLKTAEARVKTLKGRLLKALSNPAGYDPVYQACQRIFHKGDNLVLTREDQIRHQIRRRAFRRFIHGCPPRKKGDTSIGDAINWEWMVQCAVDMKAELVIVSRDSDYGLLLDGASYINDHLRQEFSERVSNKRDLLLYARLSEALKHFKVPVTDAEAKAEELLVQPVTSSPLESAKDLDELLKFLEGIAEKASAPPKTGT